MNKSVRTLGILFAVFSFAATAARAEGLRRFGVAPEPEPVYRLMDSRMMDGRLLEGDANRISETSRQLLRRPANLDPNRDIQQRRQVQRMAEEIGLPSGAPW